MPGSDALLRETADARATKAAQAAIAPTRRHSTFDGRAERDDVYRE